MSRLQIAQQLHAQLLREIEHDIEIERLLSDARYARDVLLVCDACPGTGLGELARSFRALPAKTETPTGDAPVPRPALPLRDAGSKAERDGLDGAADVTNATNATNATAAQARPPRVTHRALVQHEVDLAPPAEGASPSQAPTTDWTELAERSLQGTPARSLRQSWLARWLGK